MAFTHALVGMWYLNTKLIAGRDLVCKTMDMARKLREVYTFMQEIDPAHGKCIYIFVAPEYYFQYSNTRRFFDEPTRDAFLRYFAPLSTSIPTLLFAPGTFPWKQIKPEFDPRRYATSGRRARNQAEERRQRAVKIYDGFNTAFLFYGANGPQPYYTYHKATDAGECLPGDADTTYKASASRGIFGIRNLDFGIEVCADSSGATLGTLLGGTLVDIHLLLSQGMDHSFATRELARIPVKDGGYFIHCDGTECFATANGVWKLARGTGTHGTSGGVKVKIETEREEETIAGYRTAGYVISPTKTREGGFTTFYYTDKLGNLASPDGMAGNAIKMIPVGGAPANTQVWQLPLQLPL